jgi:hypothetical protein
MILELYMRHSHLLWVGEHVWSTDSSGGRNIVVVPKDFGAPQAKKCLKKRSTPQET